MSCLLNLGQVNSASWTNQGPQQWDQTGFVDNQSGQFPHGIMPQDPYSQADQQGQLQHGTVLYAIVISFDYSYYIEDITWWHEDKGFIFKW